MASNAEVIDAFLNNAQARIAAENLFFENGILYSYGKHWPLALKVTNEQGEEIIYLNSQKRGSTSSKHLTMVQTAISLDGRSHQHRPLEFFQDEIAKRENPNP